MASVQEMLTDSLRDMYDAERQAVKSLPKLAKAASSPELKQAFKEHLEVTRGQVARLEQVFQLLGERAKPKPCKAMRGLVEEAMEHMREHERGNELDAVLIAAGQKIEHYEIASYGTARAMAKAAGQKEAANLLQETLKEEEATDKLLTKVALNCYREMVREEAESEEGGRSSRSGGSVSKKKVAAKKTASKSRPASSSGNGTPAASSRGSKSSAGSQSTTDHEQIRSWAEERGAHPACVRGTGGGDDVGMIRLDFPGYSGGDSLEEITWDEFFEKFDEQRLALLYQLQTAGAQKSNFNKLVSREEMAQAPARKGRR
ncbi:MAG: ferritin-like domain-containing protein [Bryobacteraceae bacterium]|nr:ferritin-like domain-containing protein [Bryobacteraceae bacterium]